MRSRGRGAAPLSLALLFFSGCALTMKGGGEYEQLRVDAGECHRENYLFRLIPDFGATFDGHLRKCMVERGWLQEGANTWRWVSVPLPRPLPRPVPVKGDDEN